MNFCGLNFTRSSYYPRKCLLFGLLVKIMTGIFTRTFCRREDNGLVSQCWCLQDAARSANTSATAQSRLRELHPRTRSACFVPQMSGLRKSLDSNSQAGGRPFGSSRQDRLICNRRRLYTPAMVLVGHHVTCRHLSSISQLSGRHHPSMILTEGQHHNAIGDCYIKAPKTVTVTL